jgi:hypothetical protein
MIYFLNNPQYHQFKQNEQLPLTSFYDFGNVPTEWYLLFVILSFNRKRAGHVALVM